MAKKGKVIGKPSASEIIEGVAVKEERSTQRYKERKPGRPRARKEVGPEDYDKQFHKTMSYYGTVREFNVTSSKDPESKVRKIINVYSRNAPRRYEGGPDFGIDVSKKTIAELREDAPSKKIWPTYTAWWSPPKAKAQHAVRGKRGGRRARRKGPRAGVRTTFPLHMPSISRYI